MVRGFALASSVAPRAMRRLPSTCLRAQAAEQDAQLVGVAVTRRGPVGEQAELLILGAVFHLAALAARAILEPLRVVDHAEVSDDEARVRPRAGVLRLHGHLPLAARCPPRR